MLGEATAVPEGTGCAAPACGDIRRTAIHSCGIPQNLGFGRELRRGSIIFVLIGMFVLLVLGHVYWVLPRNSGVPVVVSGGGFGGSTIFALDTFNGFFLKNSGFYDICSRHSASVHVS